MIENLGEQNDDKKMSFALANIFKNIWENDEPIRQQLYDPTQYKNIISKEIKFESNDQISIINLLLTSINEELKNKNILPNIRISNKNSDLLTIMI